MCGPASAPPAGTVKLRQADFTPTVFLNRNVTIAASNGSTAEQAPMLDFDSLLALVLVRKIGFHCSVWLPLQSLARGVCQ